MDFGEFRRRLLDQLRQLLHCAEWTERALARHIGISQPHMHNVLSGARALTPEIADEVLRRLGMDLLDLAYPGELETALEREGATDPVWMVAPVAAGRLGPSHSIPSLDTHEGLLRLESTGIPPLREPVLVALGSDPELSWLGSGDSMALLDRSRRHRERIVDDAWYAVRWGGHGLLRRVRREGARLMLLAQMELFAALPVELPLGERPLLDLILGQVVWAGRDPRAIRRLSQTGLLLRRASAW